MKVLKHPPELLEGKWEEQVCTEKANSLSQKGCGAVVELEEKDLEVMQWFGTHFEHHYAGFKCPLCGKYNSVKGLPDHLWQKLLKRKGKSPIFDGHDESL